MAYMMHLPVAKWGRAFLRTRIDRSALLASRSDGETRRSQGEERMECCRSRSKRGGLCATRQSVVAASKPAIRWRIHPKSSGSRAQAVMPVPYEVGKWLGTCRCYWAGEAATGDWPNQGSRSDQAREGPGIPACLQRYDEPISIVDNAIIGP